YVRTTGTDPAGCTGGRTPATAWHTISKAASCAPAGSIVYVGAGTYVGSVSVTSGGAAGSPTRLVADVSGPSTGDGGDVIVDGGGAAQTIQINGANYVQFEGFAVTGSANSVAPTGGIRLGPTACAGIVLRGNRVYGNSIGIFVENSNGTVVEHNSVSS